MRELVTNVYGPDVPTDGSNPKYQRLRRFVSERPDFFEYEPSGAVTQVRPTLELVSLILSGIIQNPTESGYTAGRDWAENLLKTVTAEWDDDGQTKNWDWGENEKWHLRTAFEDYVKRINNLRIILRAEEEEQSGPEYLNMKYRTRFNDSGRVNKQFSIMNKALQGAAKDHETAVFVTLTTQPSHFDNLYESISSINKNWNRFMSWLSTDSRLGYRPEYCKVLEFQESGNPHLHAILFLDQPNDGSMPWLVNKSDLDEYWSKWQGGYINDLQPLVYENDLHDGYSTDSGWVKWDDDGAHGGLLDKTREASDNDGYQTAGEYIGKYLSATFGAIKELGDPENETFTVTQESDEEGRYPDKSDPWKIAMYWATRRKIKTISRSLRDQIEIEEDDADAQLKELLEARRYEVVGAFTAVNIPDHIRAKMRTVQDVIGEEEDEEKIVPRDRTGPPDPPPERFEDKLVGNLVGSESK
jgi:hypothetical protein